MDAAALVPSPYEDNLQTQPEGWSLMDLPTFISKVIVPPEDAQEGMLSTFSDFVAFYASKFTVEDDVRSVTRGALASLKQVQFLKDEAARQSAEGHSLIGHLVEKGLGAIVRQVLKTVIGMVVDFSVYAFRTIIVGGIEGLLEWMVRPVLMEVLGFIGLNPELWPVVALLGGVALVGYGAYKLLFEDKDDVTGDVSDADRDRIASNKDAVSIANSLVSDQSPFTGAAYPTPAGGVAVAEGAAASSLMALIARGEGSYNSVNLGATHGYRAATVDLEHMTVSQVMANQQAHNFNAAGRYQIIGDTLKLAVKALGLTGGEPFDQKTQDYIFNNYLISQKRKAIGDYISGKSNDVRAAVLAASQEWASVAAPPGAHTKSGLVSQGYTSYYAGTANNKASINAFEMAATLQAERARRTGDTTIATQSVTVTPGTVVQPKAPTNAEKAQLAVQTNPTAMAVPSSSETTVIKKGKQLIKVAA
jgi:hypothetical protein